MDINDPTLPRRHTIPRRLDDGSEQSFPETLEQNYRIVYFEALDLMIALFLTVLTSLVTKLQMLKVRDRLVLYNE